MILPAKALAGSRGATPGINIRPGLAVLEIRAIAGTTQGVLGASERLDAPQLDRWPETDQPIRARRPLRGHQTR
jgi:hypothetical protein